VTCTGSVCLFRASFSNRPLSWFGIYPDTNVAVALIVENDKVEESMAALGQENLVVTVVSKNKRESPMKAFTAIPNKGRFIEVFLTPESTPQQRKMALDLNIELLADSKEIQDPVELFPQKSSA
jgi:hypothetical protein